MVIYYHAIVNKILATQKLWRYMKYERFAEIIQNQHICFTRPDKFEDEFEGVFSERTLVVNSIFNQHNPNKADIFKEIESLINLRKKCLVISCWHINDSQSDAMWKLYGKEGIAIQTTFEKLIGELDKSSEKIYISRVEYDWGKNNESSEKEDILYDFFHKKPCYEHEKEFRAIITNLPQDCDDKKLKSDKNRYLLDEEWMSVEVDLKNIIEKVVVSPILGDDYVSNVKTLLRDNGFDDNNVNHSDINNFDINKYTKYTTTPKFIKKSC